MTLSSFFKNQKPNVHHVWVGSRIKQKELDYARLWEQANPKSKQYIWVDQFALLVNDVKHEIIAWAEHEALVQSGITSKDDLMARMVKDNALSFDASSAYFELVTRLASEKRYELQERLSGLDRKDQEIVRLKFATEMHEALHGAKAAADYSANLMRRWEKDFAFTAHEIQAGKLRDISELANSKKNKKLYSAYLQELNLRQNMAAASDIFRVIALKGKGGIYADLDLLPVSDGISEIQNTLRGKGFHISQDEGHIRGAITDSLITALKCIDGYQAGALHALDAREYFKSQNPDAVGYSDKQLDELKTVNEKRKAMIDAAVGEYLAGRSGQELAAIFNTVSDPAKTGFKGMGLGLSPKGGVINAFITAKKGNALITEVANKIAANYDFMKSIEELIKASALAKTDAEIGGLSEQIYTKLQQDYPDLVGAQLEGQFLRAMQSYMADGIAPGSMATVSISGPSVFLGVLLSKFGDDGDGVDERVVAKNAGVSGYSLDGADERASSWSNGDGMQRIAGIGDRNFLAKELHHVWLGSALRDKERDYAKLWAETNPDYSNQIWYDPDALAVNATKKEILRYAERLAAKELGGLDSPEHFIEEMRKNSQATRFIDASIRIASEKRFELNAMLEGAPAPERDGIRINFIASLRLESDGLDSAQRLKVQLLDDLARDRKVMQGKPNARNVHEVLDLPEFGVLKRAYELEMNLRQNMAAASDIARVVILKQLGGVYADVDLLPKFKLSFEEIKEKLRVNGYTLPETTGKSEGVLLTAITDAILEELGSITDYDASGAHKPPYGQPLEAGGDESVKNRHEEILRATARQIIADHQNRGGIFEPLGQMTPKTGGFLANAGNVYVNNNFMASQAGGDVISRLIEEMSKRYDFLLRGDVLETIKALAAGDPNGWTLTAELNKKYDALKREEGRESAKPSSFVGALSDYMADGMSQYAQATVKLSGPKVLLEVLSEFLGLPPSKQGKDAFEEFLTTKLNGYASDAQDSSWLVHNLDELFDKTVQRIFGSDSTDVSSSDHNGEHNGRTHWAEPNLAGSDSGSASDASFNYDHQVIIQLDGDETAQAAAEALYGKRPDRGAYAQDRDGSLLFFERNADGAVVPTGSPFEHWKSDRQVRLTFVGHGEVDAQASYFGGKTPAQFLQQLGGVLGAVGGNAERRVLINLVACGLEDTSSQQQHTYAGQVAQGLLDVARQAGLNPEHITLRAREGDVRVDAAGTKSSQGGVIQYDFRSADQRFVRSLDDLNTGTSTQTPVHHEPHSGESVEGSHDPADARKGILRGTTAHLRSEREALLLQLAEVIALRDKRNQGIASLQSPGEGLKLVPELVREATGGGYEVGFALLKSADHASINETNAHWVHTDNDAFMRWKERAQALGRKISAGVSRAGESAMEAGKYLFAPDTEGSPVHTIASAFLLQALIGPEGAILAGSRQSALEALSGRKLEELSADEVAALENRLTYLRVQQGVNYAALTSSLVNDGAELAKLFSILKDGNTGATGLTTGLAKGSAALGAIGVAFDIGSVVFAGIDLANAQTDRERAEALVNLGFSMVSTGMELGSIALGAMAGGAGSSAVGATTAVGSAAGVAGISSAATAAAVLGSLGVIVSGISIGAGALVHTIHQERDKIDGGLWMLEDYLAAAVDHAPEIPVSPLGMALETLKELEGRGLKDVVRGASIGGGLAGLIAILGGAIAEGIANATDSEDAKRWAAAMKIVEHAAEGKKLPAQPPTPSHHYGALESVSPGVFKFHDSLAATEFDLNTGKLTFAPVRVGALKHAIGAVVPGLSGKYLDLLAPFIKGDGASKTVDVSKLTDGSVLVLPHQPAVDFSYQLRTYGYANLDHEFPLLKAFEEATDDHEFYLWGTGGLTANSYVPGFLAPHYHDTIFTLNLDEKHHVVVVPSVDHSHIGIAGITLPTHAKMSYVLAGAGGDYTVSLPAVPTEVKIESSFAAAERWTFNLSNVVLGQNDGSTSQTHALPKGFFDKLNVTQHGIAVAGKRVVTFDGPVKRDQLMMLTSLDSTGTSHLIWRLSATETAQQAPTLRTHDVETWNPELDEQDGLFLRVGKREDLSRSVMDKLVAQIRDAGIHRRFISFGTADECVGELDLNTGGYALSDHDDATGLTRLYIDGVVVREDSLNTPFLIRHFERNDAMGVIATHTFGDEQALQLSYLDGHLIVENLEVSNAFFNRYALGDPGAAPLNTSPIFATISGVPGASGNELGKWLSQHASGAFHMSDDKGNSAAMSVSDDHTITTSSYAFKRQAFDLTIDVENRRAMVRLHDCDHFALAELDEFTEVLRETDTLEVMALDPEFSNKRLALVMDLDVTSALRKHLTLLTSGAVDLKVEGSDISWDADGPDLSFITPQHSALRWLCSDEAQLSSNTLNFGDGPAELEAALTHHEAQRQPQQGVTPESLVAVNERAASLEPMPATRVSQSVNEDFASRLSTTSASPAHPGEQGKWEKDARTFVDALSCIRETPANGLTIKSDLDLRPQTSLSVLG